MREQIERWIGNFPVALILQGGTAVALVIIAPRLETPANTAAYVGWVLIAFVLAGLPLVLTEFRQREVRSKAEALADMSTEYLGMISGYIDPAVDVLRAFTTATDLRGLGDLEGMYRSKILECAQHVCGPRSEDVRALLFTRSGYTMSQAWRSGGTKDSKRTFTNHSKDPAGQEAWRLASKGEPTLYEDVRDAAPAHYELPDEREYQTFITCGIIDRHGKLQGMLNVDAREPGSLTPEDKRIVKHLVGLLAAGIDFADAIRPHLE